MDQHDVVRQTMQNDLNSMPWDGSGPIDSLQNSINYFVTSYGPAGLSYQEIAAMVSDAYHYNGVPEEGWTPNQEGSDTAGLSVEEISNRVATHNANLKEIERAYQEGLLDYDQKQKAIDESRSSLVKNKDQGLSSNSAYFSAVSPDAFQSQIGNYNQKVLDAYTEGNQTIGNNQSALDFAKRNFEDRTIEARAAENAFDAGTGQYSYGAGFNPGTTVAQAPVMQSVTANPLAQAATLIPQWAPNYGGLSTMQAKKEQDPLNQYMG